MGFQLEYFTIIIYNCNFYIAHFTERYPMRFTFITLIIGLQLPRECTSGLPHTALKLAIPLRYPLQQGGLKQCGLSVLLKDTTQLASPGVEPSTFHTRARRLNH